MGDNEPEHVEQFYSVTVPYGTFGIVVKNGRIIRAAPIASWAKGMSLERFTSWVKGKKGSVVLIESNVYEC